MIVCFCFVLVIMPITLAHGNILYDIDLDFDLVAKEKITSVAQEFLGTNAEPLNYDYNKELIIVNFEANPVLAVAIDAFDYRVFGFKDYSKLSISGSVSTTESERKDKAQEIFEFLPNEYQEELVYGEEKVEGNLFRYTWYRFVDNLVVPEERLEVVVDGVNGEVVEWQQNIFFLPKQVIDTVPAIDRNVAQIIPQLRYGATSLDTDPVLIVYEGKPVWVFYMKVLYPIYIGISAQDGEVLFTGAMKGKLPGQYSIGEDVSIVKSELIEKIYGGIN
jgi:hypothetical protein